MELPDSIKPIFSYDAYSCERGTEGVSVIIPIRGIERNSSLLVCIDYILKQSVCPLEILVVEESQNKEINLGRHLNNQIIRYFFIKGGEFFNKSKCINLGVMNSKYDLINMNDVDMIMPKDYLFKYCKRMLNCDMCYMSKDIYYLDRVPENNSFDWNGKRWTDGRKWDYAGGNFMVKKKCFIDVGGFDEQFCGYGGEDGDFYVRIQKLLKFDRGRSLDYPLLHMPHSNKEHINKENNDILFKRLRSIDPKSRIPSLRQDLLKYVESQ